jgi:hypothetical protein
MFINGEECCLRGCCAVWFFRTADQEEHTASIIRVKRISKLGTTLTVNSNRSTLQLLAIAKVVPSSPILVILMEAIHSSETSVLTTATQ